MAEIGFSRRGYSSGVEHSTADREVPGSIPGVPLVFLAFFIPSLASIIHWISPFSSGARVTLPRIRFVN